MGRELAASASCTNAHRIELRGESMRKTRTGKNRSTETGTTPGERRLRSASLSRAALRCGGLAKRFPTGLGCDASLHSDHSHIFHLTIPITRFTISPPASLRSDRPDRMGRISDRFQTGTLIVFTGIRKRALLEFARRQLSCCALESRRRVNGGTTLRPSGEPPVSVP
jgi:hypothetical protein